MILDEVRRLIIGALEKLDIFYDKKIELEHPVDFSHGDLSTNVAMILAKKQGKNPKTLAEKIVVVIKKTENIEKIEVAGLGFINFHLSKEFFTKNIERILNEKEKYGKNKTHDGEKIIIEYTDPNPFKEFHIGHLMSNTIGESLARVFEYSGAEVKRANYQGDVGLHVAKALWAWQRKIKDGEAVGKELKNFSLNDRIAALGSFYTIGSLKYEDDKSGKIKKEIEEVNKKIYSKEDGEITKLYEFGRAWSLEYFEKIYERLGTKFDFYFFESESGIFGKEIVEENIERGIFEKSDGAVIFRGEDYGLHTRVFINREGLPTYEAKELGLAQIKSRKYLYDSSYIVTGNEITEYFKVLLKAMEFIFPDLAKKTHHIAHGMLRLPSGKMSSRKGEIISAEELLDEIKKLVLSKMDEDRFVNESDREEIADQIAVGAVKYSILKQAAGKDIIFDLNTSLSFEGNSGPYLQYTYARAYSILEKAKNEGITLSHKISHEELSEIERQLYRFPFVVERVQKEKTSHYLATYLFELAQAFNNFYAQEKIVGGGKHAPYRLALTQSVAIILKNGLYLLGIEAPKKM